ncbi:MAG TPA: hypothetical protein VHX42_02225 [Candidatus Babeliales bacterium]|nr:hypothetical protein [Candidatus Babeliales bacterium]
MKHSVYIFLTTYLCIATTSLIAMEELPYFAEASKGKSHKEKKSKILAEITIVQKPQYAQYLANNHIVVAGKNGCSIIDPQTNTEIKKISDRENQKLATHPNKKMFALIDKNIINIYDATTHSLIWSKKVEGSFEKEMDPFDIIGSVTFAHHDTTIALITTHYQQYSHYRRCYPESYHIKQYDYITDKSSSYRCLCNDYPPIITFNPIHNEIHVIISSVASFHRSNSDIVFSKNTKQVTNYGGYYKQFCQYNPNGSYIAQVDYQKEMFIINLQSTDQCKSFKKKKTEKYGQSREDFKNILFYSNSVLAIVSTFYIYKQNGFYHTLLSYFDIHTKELIHENELLDVSKNHDFSFNPTKTKVILALQDRCVILPVPFKVIYKDITKKSFFYLLFLLKNYTSQCDDIEIPHDVTLLIAQTLLERYRRP